MLNRPSKAAIVPVGLTIGALLAALLLLLLVSSQAFAQDAGTMSYAENGTDPVYTFTANDPEGVDTIVWTLFLEEVGEDGVQDIDGDGTDDVVPADTTDFGDFKISADGVLSFSNPPNYEMPTGGADDTASLADRNVYSVVVQASDGGTSNNANIAMKYLTWFKVTVRVTDVEEPGRLALNPHDLDGGGAVLPGVTLVQPHVGVQITAVLTDGDGPVTADGDPDGETVIPDVNIVWRWFRTSDPAQQGNIILELDARAELSTASHTPRDRADANDVGMYLRVKATYEDNHGKRKTAEAVTRYPVLAAIVNTNTLPHFAATHAERSIAENMPRGTAIGRPVTAIDPDDEKLSYSLVAGDDAAVDTDIPPQPELNRLFKIDPETGQITVNAFPLDFEERQQYEFLVKATDSRAGSTGGDGANATDDLDVTIRIIDVDEMPNIVPAARNDENMVNTMLIRHAGGNAIEHGETADLPVATYLITDDDEGTPVLSVSGDDAGMFAIKYDVVTEGVLNDAILAFKANPDFESPADKNKNNIYEVTVEAADGNNIGKLNVTVKVTNEEEAGKVTLSHQQPLIGEPLMAEVADSDGGFGPSGALTQVAWVWHVVDTADGVCPAADPDPDPNPALDANPGTPPTATAWAAIKGASEATFTPRAVDDGRCLQATATYLDRTYHYVQPPVAEGDAGMGFGASAQVVSGVVREDPANRQPEFAGAEVRFVPENSPGHEYVGDPVTATDPDTGDVLTYSLSGADEDHFYIAGVDIEENDGGTPQNDIADRGQIRVDGNVLTVLDHEETDKYNVDVHATDSTSNHADASDSTDVDIFVTDVDERPRIWVDVPGDEVEDEHEVNYAENGTSPVLTLEAEDPEGVKSIVWSILEDEAGVQDLGIADPAGDDDVGDDDVADFALFSIDGDGVLRFKTSPDFEVLADANTDNTYNVVVQASDGGTTGDTTDAPLRGFLNWFKVAVTVTDVEELGTIALTPADADNEDIKLLQPEVDVPIEASLLNGDGDVADEDITWKWERKSPRASTWDTIPGVAAMSDTYTPQDVALPSPRIDVGHLLRVTASYNDANDDERIVHRILDNAVLGAVDDNTPPAFALPSVTRTIVENPPRGAAVGAPVIAEDEDLDVPPDGDPRIVSYWLEGEDGEGADNDLFTVDAATGQIRVANPDDFDYENPQGGEDNTTEYVVSVMATDSSGDPTATPIVVTINLTGADEKPVIGLIADADVAVIEHAGGVAIERIESAVGLTVAGFTVDDPEDGTPGVSLSGADGQLFNIEPIVPPPTDDQGSGTLVFKTAPNFETPADKDRNNIYEVTITADDGRNVGELHVTIKVTNDEEPGKVDLGQQQPEIGTALTAVVSDPDGGFNRSNGKRRDDVTDETWEWHATTDRRRTLLRVWLRLVPRPMLQTCGPTTPKMKRQY